MTKKILEDRMSGGKYMRVVALEGVCIITVTHLDIDKCTLEHISSHLITSIPYITGGKDLKITRKHIFSCYSSISGHGNII